MIALDYVWQEDGLRKERNQVLETVIQLQNQIGYNGLIHNYKNYILRPDESRYRELALQNYQHPLTSVQELESFGDKWLGEFRMSDTRAMLAAYRQRLNEVSQLISQGRSLRAIDRQVRFDDEPSYREILKIAHALNQSIDARASTVLRRSLIFALITHEFSKK